MPRLDWDRSGSSRDQRDARACARTPPPDPQSALLALQGSAGNAAVSRQLTSGRVLQRLAFARFTGMWGLKNWGSYSKEENELLRREADLARFLGGLEPWSAGDLAITQELATFSGLQKSTIAQAQYAQTKQDIIDIENRIRVRRAALLNENPNRVAGEPPVFKNHLPDAIAGEIEQYLGRQRLSPGRTFRISVPIPTENAPFEAERRAAKKDPELEREFEDALARRVADFHSRLADQGELLWVYSINGILAIGSPEENKHSIVAGGDDVWAAGKVKLKIDEGATYYGRYLDAQAKIAMYKRRIGQLEADTTLDEASRTDQLRNYRANLTFQAGDAEKSKQEYERRGFKPGPGQQQSKTVIVDFDSGHYQPSKAWMRTVWAWKNLGYTVEFNPFSRTE